MEPHNDYAIGSADSFGVITTTSGIRPIEYDLKQVHEEGVARYNASLCGEWKGYKTEELRAGERISLSIAEDVRGELPGEVQGWVVPDRMLGLFLHWMDEPVYRERQA